MSEQKTNEERYFVLHCNEDGMSVLSFTKETLLTDVFCENGYYGTFPETMSLEDFENELDPNCWGE